MPNEESLLLRFAQARPQERFLWSHSYDRDIRSVFGMYTEIAREIARAAAGTSAEGRALPG